MSKENNDRNARGVGFVAGATTVAGIGAAVSGSSAAGLTSVLATAGSVVGGGMAAGVAVTAAAPLAVGAAAYGVYKWLTDK